MELNRDEQLFLKVLSDLRLKLEGDGYDYIKAAGLLRQLLVDGSLTLVSQANKNHKLKIIFIVRKKEISPSADFSWVSLFVPLDKEDESIKCDLHSFLSIKILKSNCFLYSVKDTIKYASNIMGGIHSGKPKTPKEKEYILIQNRNSHVMGASIYAHSLFSIIETTIKALEPLETAIIGHTPTGGF